MNEGMKTGIFIGAAAALVEEEPQVVVAGVVEDVHGEGLASTRGGLGFARNVRLQCGCSARACGRASGAGRYAERVHYGSGQSVGDNVGWPPQRIG